MGTALIPLAAAGIGALGQQMTNASNAGQVKQQEAYQTDMSDTAWQRGVADMKAAGLNPALAYQQGGASSPMGSTAQMQSPVSSALHSAGDAVQAQQQQAQTALTQAQTKNTEAQAMVNIEEAKSRMKLNDAIGAKTVNETGQAVSSYEGRMALLNAQTKQSAQSSAESAARTGLMGPEKQMLEYQIPGARNAANAADTWFGKNVMPYMSSASAGVDMFSKLLPSFGSDLAGGIAGLGKNLGSLFMSGRYHDEPPP